MPEDRPKVLILGAGFGGLWTARALARAPVSVTLLDRDNYHTFLPLLYQIGAAELEPFAIARPVRSIVRGQENLHFLVAEALRADLRKKVVHTSRGVYAYDYLVIAIGSVPHDFGINGVRTHAYPLRTLEDGVALRSHVLSRFEAAMHEPDGAARRRALRFVIVGGGPTGVEYAGALSELVRGPLARDYPALAGQSSIVLLEASDRLIGGLPRRLGDYAAKRLARMQVEVKLESAVAGVEAAGARLADGTEIAAETVVWTAGVRGAPEAERWGLPVERDGLVRVQPTLQVPGHPDVYVVGDLARFDDEDGEPLPMLAQVAMQGGERAADNIRRSLGEEPALPFEYRDKGVMAVIGRNAAAARVAGRSFTGFPAWLLWVVIHLFYLIGFRNRLAVMLNWAWDYLFFERVARIVLPFRERAPAWPEAVRAGPRRAGLPLALGLATSGLPVACGLLSGPADEVELVVAAAHIRAPSPIVFEIRNRTKAQVTAVGCDAQPRVEVLERLGGDWHVAYNTCFFGDRIPFLLDSGETFEGAIENELDPGLYVLRFDYRTNADDGTGGGRTRSKGFQITR